MRNSVKTKLTYLTAGAAGMYCGSCMHDNTLVRALNQIGYDASLVPTYTPIRTDEESIAVDQVFFGGINVYLQEKIPFFRWLPRFADRFLDRPGLIQRATAFSTNLKPEVLGKLAISMLKGSDGHQAKEVKRLTDWLQVSERPDLIVFTNLLIGGVIPQIKQTMDCPVIVTLQGDDVFLDSLLPKHRARCIELMRSISNDVDGFICHCEFYRDYMANYLGIDARKIHVTPLGLDVSDFEAIEQVGTTVSQKNVDYKCIGYLARLAEEKGLHLLVDAFIKLCQQTPEKKPKLVIAGWMGEHHKPYAQEQFNKLDEAGLQSCYEYLGSIDRHEKIDMLAKLDVFCVPAKFQEPKGIYALEAMAAGVPVVAPDHGAFPEMIRDTGGGRLFAAHDSTALAQTLQNLLDDNEQRIELGQRGRTSVLGERNAQAMAVQTKNLLDQFLQELNG